MPVFSLNGFYEEFFGFETVLVVSLNILLIIGLNGFLKSVWLCNIVVLFASLNILLAISLNGFLKSIWLWFIIIYAASLNILLVSIISILFHMLHN